jgi:GcrA cell cycle regulator
VARPTPPKPAPAPEPIEAETPIAPMPEPELEDAPPPEGGITLMELNLHTCRWPQGNPLHESFRFCGAQPKRGSIYCTEHHRRAFVPNTKKARLAPRT